MFANMPRSPVSYDLVKGLVLVLLLLTIPTSGQFLQTSHVQSADMQRDEWLTQVTYMPSGKEIVSGGIDGHVIFWDASSGKALREAVLPAIVLSVAVSKNGDIVAVGDAAGNVSVIDSASGKVKFSFAADKRLVNAVAISDDGTTVAAGGSDGIVRLGSAADGKLLGELDPAQGNVVALGFAKDRVVIGIRGAKDSKRSGEVWDWRAKTRLRTFDEGPCGMRAMTVSSDGQLVAIADHVSPTLLSMLPSDNGGMEVSVRALPDNDQGTAVAIWDIGTGKRVGLVNGETGARSIAFSPDNKVLATAGANGVMLHDTGLFTEVGRIDTQTSVDALAFSPDSKQLVIAREKEPIVRFGEGGTDKLVDPFFTSLIMQVRDGINSGIMLQFGAKMHPVTKGPASATGGSSIQLWQVTTKTAPADTKTWEAVTQVFADKPDEASRTLDAVIRDNPNYGEAQRLKVVFFQRKDPAKALASLQQTVKADPACVACWRSLGDLQYGMKDYPEAIKSYDAALKLRPDYGLVIGHEAQAYGELGLSLISSENSAKVMDAAKAALVRAIELRPGVEQFYTNLGAAYYFRSEFDKDINLLLIAKRLRPDHARIYYNLGHAYRYKGDKKSAIDAYKRYVAMGEEGEEDRVEKAKQLIAELSK